MLVVEDGRTQLRPADRLMGLSPTETADRLRAELGTEFRVAAIGAAGEHGVRYAAIANDGRLAGRTGAGAVMGAKRLKAIAVRGSRLPQTSDPRQVARLARDLAARSVGPATAKYREIGTVANVAFFNRLGLLPTHNFAEGRFDEAEAISERRCAWSTIPAGMPAPPAPLAANTITVPGTVAPRPSARLEYETLFALGSLCGVGDPNAVLRASALCDELGMDAISAGGTVAWAMECRQRGVDLGVPAGEIPCWGDGEAVLRTLRQIGTREGLGNLLADGSRAAAERVDQGSDAWAMHVKGLELPGTIRDG